MRSVMQQLVVAAGLCAAAMAGMGAATASLPTGLTIDPKGVTTGGLSAGAFFSAQYFVAFSDEIAGASVLAGGPWYCAEGQEIKALTSCMSPNIAYPAPDPKSLAEIAQWSASQGAIAGVGNITGKPVWLYSGQYDSVVNKAVVQAASDFFTVLGAKSTFETSVPSEHCFPTLEFGNSCAYKGSPFINDCHYDAAGTSLQALYGPLTNGTAVAENLIEFDQTPFGGGSNSIASTGFVYVPTACKTGTCKLHINLHGCEQGVSQIGSTYAEHVGLNSWAEGSNIVVLYPNFAPDIFAGNPNGCADWWGYTNSDYAARNGIQMQFVHNLFLHLQS